MSPEILRAKLAQLQTVLNDLRPHVTSGRKAQEAAHYEIERQVQLAVDGCVAAARRIHVIEGLPMPETSRQVFVSLAAAGKLSAPLAAKLALAVGLRNLLVHEYGELDRDVFFGGLEAGYEALVEFTGEAVRFA